MAKKIYEIYAEHDDITFIMEDCNISLEVKGFYFGKPNKEATKQFYGSLKAEFD